MCTVCVTPHLTCRLYKSSIPVIPGEMQVEVEPVNADLPMCESHATIFSFLALISSGTCSLSLPSFTDTDTFDPSLLPLKLTPELESVASTKGVSSALEIQEFPPDEQHKFPFFEKNRHYQMALTFRHHLYIYPFTLKYDTQMTFPKVGLIHM